MIGRTKLQLRAAYRQESEQEYLTFIWNDAAGVFAELDRGDGIRGTPDESWLASLKSLDLLPGKLAFTRDRFG